MTPSSAPASVAFSMPAIDKVTLNHKVSLLGPDWHLQLKNGRRLVLLVEIFSPKLTKFCWTKHKPELRMSRILWR